MFQFYAAGYAHATDPFEVARLIHHAVTTDTPQLRYAVSWGGPEFIAGRAAMSDEEWVAPRRARRRCRLLRRVPVRVRPRHRARVKR